MGPMANMEPHGARIIALVADGEQRLRLKSFMAWWALLRTGGASTEIDRNSQIQIDGSEVSAVISLF